jgi:mono/diheme cytochrome c family protein
VLFLLGLLTLVVAPMRAATSPQDAPPAVALAQLSGEGQVIYNRDCASCHGTDGTGDGAGPALVGERTLADTMRVITRILTGSRDRGMDEFGSLLDDRDVAAVATYVRSAWGNAYGVVDEAAVTAIRARLPPSSRP